MSFSSPSRPQPGPVLPLASMIDILFLLLIFFMTASVLREEEQQIDVSLPHQESAGTRSGRKTQLLVTITDEGDIFVGARRHSIDSLRVTLEALEQQFPEESIVIRGDQDSRLGLTVKVLDMAYSVGLRHVYLATTQRESEL